MDQGAETVYVKTRIMGRAQVGAERIFTCARGLFAYPHLQRHALLDLPRAGQIYWLQALDDWQVGFVVVETGAILPSYRPAPTAADLAELGCKSLSELTTLVLAAATQPLLSPGGEIAVNLRAPLFLNPQRRLAKQVLLPGDAYPHRQRLLIERLPPLLSLLPGGNRDGGKKNADRPNEGEKRS